ncbi:hypothetical protein HYQ44_006982 [Verticillium longisporum]|nr:hypothetical protein HYQ44_006982 [Verticillium longisporum]
MCGSCANCWFNASGSRCSFHETNLPQQHQHIPAIQLQHSVPVFTGLAGPFRIDAAARQLALATAEYSDFLQAQQAHEQQQQQHEQGPEGDHGQGMREVEEGE